MTISINEVYQSIQPQGLNSSIIDSYGPDLNSDDATLNKLWQNAYRAVQSVKQYVFTICDPSDELSTDED